MRDLQLPLVLLDGIAEAEMSHHGEGEGAGGRGATRRASWFVHACRVVATSDVATLYATTGLTCFTEARVGTLQITELISSVPNH